MKILITGGTGFIGSALIRHLLNNFNSYEILNIDKLTYASNNSLQEFTHNKNYSHLNIDITDKNQLVKSFLDFKPNAKQPICRALVPLLAATPYFAFTFLHISFSKISIVRP